MNVEINWRIVLQPHAACFDKFDKNEDFPLTNEPLHCCFILIKKPIHNSKA